jgi:hypothetical protein
MPVHMVFQQNLSKLFNNQYISSSHLEITCDSAYEETLTGFAMGVNPLFPSWKIGGFLANWPPLPLHLLSFFDICVIVYSILPTQVVTD